MNCDAVKQRLFAYVDHELSPEDERQLESHLASCGECRRLADVELAFQETYVERLRPIPAPERVWVRTTRLLGDLARSRSAARRARRRRWVCGAAVALALIAVGVAAGLLVPRQPGRAAPLDRLAESAVKQHRQLLSGTLGTDVQETMPGVTTAWLQERLPFDVALPTPSTAGLELVGGRIGSLLDGDVGMVAYRLDGAPVSLFLVSEAAYGRLGLAGEPRFNVLSHADHDVVVWRSRGVAYTLVSQIGERACLVCHSPAEHLGHLPPPAGRSAAARP